MTQVRFSARRPTVAVFSLTLVLIAGGCGGGARPAAAPEATQMEVRPIAMMGESAFFDGQVGVMLTVSRGLGRGRTGKGGRHDDNTPPSVSEVFTKELGDTEHTDVGETIAKMQALQVRGSPMPPVTLRLKLSNHAKDAASVEIIEVNSDLGNFAVQPDRLSLAPGQTLEPEPMNSQLGVTSDEIPVKVSLRWAGRTESQTIVVKSLLPPAAAK